MEILKRISCRTFVINGSLFANYSRYWASTVVSEPNSTPYFTREGDNGFSQVHPGERRSKDDSIFNAIGTTDELSSYIGLAREFAKDGKHSYTDKLKRVQCILVDISTAILKTCTPNCKAYISPKHTKDLEDWINEYSSQLPPLQNFVIPVSNYFYMFSHYMPLCDEHDGEPHVQGGGKACTSLHVARTICRRAERCVVPLVKGGDMDEEAQVYLNRLSDFLFTISRYAAWFDKKNEYVYIPRPEDTRP